MKCRLKSCPVELPDGTHGSIKYCSDTCYKEARKQNQRDHNNLEKMNDCPTWNFPVACQVLRQAW